MSENGRRITHAERARSRDGYFPPESVIRRISGTPVITILGAGPAVLYQVAHPLVAVGVVEHTDYKHDLWQRWVTNFRALYLIVFGSRAEADAIGERVCQVHDRVHGTTREALGPFPAGTRYAAGDPELLLWVTATLTEVALRIYGRYVGRLSTGEQERFYRDMTVLARITGVPDSAIPGQSLSDFREYWQACVTGLELTVTEHAREILETVLHGSLPIAVRGLMPANRLACAGLLTPRLREEYGLRWSPAQSLALAASAASIRAAGAPLLLAAGRIPQPVQA